MGLRRPTKRSLDSSKTRKKFLRILIVVGAMALVHSHQASPDCRGRYEARQGLQRSSRVFSESVSSLARQIDPTKITTNMLPIKSVD